MKKNKVGWIVFWLFIIYMAAGGNYMNIDDPYISDNVFWLALIDVIIISIVMVAVPFILRLINGKKFDIERGRKICKWNSILLFVFSVILMSALEIGIVGGLGALIYYYINKWLFVDEEVHDDTDNTVDSDEEDDIKFYCSNCNNYVDEFDEECYNCGDTFIQDSEDTKESEDFEDDEEHSERDVDEKYSDLMKLKKLLDEDIISKDEFEREKGKILD